MSWQTRYISRNSKYIATNNIGAKDPAVSAGETTRADLAAIRAAVVMPHILSKSRLTRRANCPK